jgi:hypothetical protein
LERDAIKLLDFAFFVDHVFANNRVKLFDFHFLRHGTLVLVGRVEMTGTSTGVQTNFITHDFCSRLNFYAVGANVNQYGIDATFVNNTHTFSGNAQSDEAFLCLNPETVSMQVGQKTTLGVVFCVRNIVTSDWAFAGHLTYLGHCFASCKISSPDGSGTDGLALKQTTNQPGALLCAAYSFSVSEPVT